MDVVINYKGKAHKANTIWEGIFKALDLLVEGGHLDLADLERECGSFQTFDSVQEAVNRWAKSSRLSEDTYEKCGKYLENKGVYIDGLSKEEVIDRYRDRFIEDLAALEQRKMLQIENNGSHRYYRYDNNYYVSNVGGVENGFERYLNKNYKDVINVRPVIASYKGNGGDDSDGKSMVSSNQYQLNTIFYGPPGTGKTYHAVNAAIEIIDPEFYAVNKMKRDKLKDRFDKLIGEKRIAFVTFHQSFSYEDFVEGIRAEERNGSIHYYIEEGVFRVISDNARGEKIPLVLIIDEINRGNTANIFGELITLIEPSKREGEVEELTVSLPYSKELFSVPSNLYVVGTMNTADRSLSLLDAALRRRFNFKEMRPEPELLADVDIEGVEVKRLLESINSRIELLYDRDHCIGHSFFMGLLENGDLEALENIFKQNVIPLLEEYFFEDWSKVSMVLGDHLKEDQYKIINKVAPGREAKLLFGDDIPPSKYTKNFSALKEVETYLKMYE